MKFIVASFLILVGSCATLRHTEKVKNLKESIVFKDKDTVEKYLSTIKPEQLKAIVDEVSSDKYLGRLTGEKGHNDVCDYLRNYYNSLEIDPPPTHPNYYQKVPQSELPDGLNDSQNVIAYIEGSEFPDEYIILSAHSDHEGVIDDKIYNGADDNGSGTAALLEIAEAFKIAYNNGTKPKRSIVFLHVTAEEFGLYGSLYYTKNPVFPIENTITTLNVDMIGRVDDLHKENENYIYLIGADRKSTELNFITEKANSTFTNLNLDYRYNDKKDANRYYSRSDHYNFALKDVPVIFFFNGEHDDYTKETDTADKIHYNLLTTRTQLVFTTAWYLANSENRLNPELL